MNIKKLATKLKQKNIEFELIENSPNYPVLRFNMESNKFNFYYRESFTRRTKFHKKYNAFMEITTNEKSKISILKIKIDELFSSPYTITENKIYSNISNIKEDKMIDFINLIQK